MDHSPGFLRLVESVLPRVTEIPVDQVAARQAAGARLFDVREDNEWAAAHAAGAEHLSKGIIERDIERTVPDTAAEVLLYCGGGFRSALAADALQRMGYTNVKSVAGGWRAWQAAGLPTE
ncbi:MAG: rhodanese-like domain-containing protein [Pseudonocardia sp.]|nr:rhodanese-like domain-containing protein [Pseudonocardia sp.]